MSQELSHVFVCNGRAIQAPQFRQDFRQLWLKKLVLKNEGKIVKYHQCWIMTFAFDKLGNNAVSCKVMRHFVEYWAKESAEQMCKQQVNKNIICFCVYHC